MRCIINEEEIERWVVVDIKYQAVGNTVYEIYMSENIQKYIFQAIKDKLQDLSLRIEVISYRQLKQEGRLSLLHDIEPLLNMRGREIEMNCLYLLLYSEGSVAEEKIRLLDCAPFSEQGLAFIFHNPGLEFNSEKDLFKTATSTAQAAARISAHFFSGDLGLSQIQANVYQAFYTAEDNTVTAILLADEQMAMDTKLTRKIASSYHLQIVSGLQKDLNGKQQAVLRLTKKLA